MSERPRDARYFDALRAEARTKLRRAHVVSRARKLFLEIGYADCTIEQIAQRAGLAKSTFYAYFEGKESLLEACRVTAAEELGARLDRALVRREGPAARLEALYAVTFAYVGAHASLYATGEARAVDALYEVALAKLALSCGVELEAAGGVAPLLLYGALLRSVRGEALEAPALAAATLRALGRARDLVPEGEER